MCLLLEKMRCSKSIMKKLVIVGIGGFGREVAWLVDLLPKWIVEAFQSLR
jgi:uncharacterized membrane protein